MAAAVAAAAAAAGHSPGMPHTSVAMAPLAVSPSNTAKTNGPPTASTSRDKSQQRQEVLSLEMFVHALQQETEFDRKQYDVDIEPLIARMGEGAGFSQLGRGICEHVLTGTKFNFRQVY